MVIILSQFISWANLGLIFEWIIALYFVQTVAYSLILSVAAFFYRPPKRNVGSTERRILILIPAYKEDSVIIDVARTALAHDYPEGKFDVAVIADSLQNETMERLARIEALKIIEVNFEVSTKIKAIRYAVDQLESNYEIVLVLDADNVMAEGFLRHINEVYSDNIRAIQGRRVAKNKNTSFAILDALSEVVNNHIYRQGATALGLSSPIIGSGMAVSYDAFKEAIFKMNPNDSGEDKDMEIRLIEQGVKVMYLNDAIIYDEKVENPEVFENQRKRWIYSQYHHLFKEFMPGLKKLMVGDIVYFNSTILRNIQLPRSINMGLLILIATFVLVFPSVINIPYGFWIILLSLLILSNFIAVPRSFYNKDSLKALLSLPKVFFIMFTLLFKLKGAKKSFIHTPHSNSEP